MVFSLSKVCVPVLSQRAFSCYGAERWLEYRWRA